MDVADMLDEIDDHGFTDTDVDRKLAMLNDSMYDAASRDSWPFMEETVTLTFSGSSAVPSNLPADFERPVSLVRTADKVKLTPVRYEIVDQWGADLTESGQPLYYYLLADQLNVWPVPGASETLRMRYIKTPATLTAGTLSAAIDWPVRHHRVIVLGALFKLYDMEDDPELAVRFQQQYEQRIQQMAGDVFSRQLDRPDVIYTDPWFDGDFDW